jgi:hypothetical protein
LTRAERPEISREWFSENPRIFSTARRADSSRNVRANSGGCAAIMYRESKSGTPISISCAPKNFEIPLRNPCGESLRVGTVFPNWNSTRV